MCYDSWALHGVCVLTTANQLALGKLVCVQQFAALGKHGVGIDLREQVQALHKEMTQMLALACSVIFTIPRAPATLLLWPVTRELEIGPGLQMAQYNAWCHLQGMVPPAGAAAAPQPCFCHNAGTHFLWLLWTVAMLVRFKTRAPKSAVQGGLRHGAGELLSWRLCLFPCSFSSWW